MDSFPRRMQMRRALSVARGRLRSLVAHARGALLLETIMAVGVLAIISAGSATGLTLVSRARTRIERDSTAEYVARNQMEYVFSLGYKTPVYNLLNEHRARGDRHQPPATRRSSSGKRTRTPCMSSFRGRRGSWSSRLLARSPGGSTSTIRGSGWTSPT